MSADEELISWYEKLAENPDYYTHTEAGQEELAQMIRKESERLLAELGKAPKRTREIIWFSRHCLQCRSFENNNGRMQCKRWDVRIVKPFYGRAIWSKIPSRRNPDEKELEVRDIDWGSKWQEISDAIVERAIDLVNDGYPYFCFKAK